MRATKLSTPRPTSNAATVPDITSSKLQPGSDGLAKPKPLPKPRPWSIVGVDRKSGELTSVIGGCGGGGSSETDGGEGSCKDDNTATSTFQAALTASAAAAARKSSVRDLINNMNKVGGDKSAETTPTAEVFRRKGNSLPRGTAPPADDKSGSGAGSSSPRIQMPKPKESTSDDPRILKLDDDFAYDEVLDV
jgi:hypothetical protein